MPRKFVLTYKTEPGTPRYTALLSRWDLSVGLSDSIFDFVPPSASEKIEFYRAPVGAMVSYLPQGNTTKTVNGQMYYLYAGVYYQAKMVDGGTGYVVTRNPSA